MQQQKATFKHLDNLVRPVYAVAWRELGEKLDIPSGKLNTLQKDYPKDSNYCCGEVLKEWRDQDHESLWSTLLKALDSPEVKAVMSDYWTADGGMLEHRRSEMLEAVCNVAECLQENSRENRYKVSPDDWPNIELKHFTSVALIHYKKGHNKREEIEVIADIQHKGKISLTEPLGNVNLTKTTKDISEIFAPMETSNVFPRTILIEGAPGIGKTTLSKEIVFQWSKNNLLNHKKLVILVFLRDPKAQRIRSLTEFVSEYCCYTEKCNAILEEYIKFTRGEEMAIVLDGYDELPEEMRKNTTSFFISLIHQECNDLRKSMVVITSRLTVSVELHNRVDRRVEILGFTEDNRKAYITQALEDNTEGANKLLNYLDRNPAINAYCYIPLNMTILLCLFKECGENAELPTTQTEINKQFICITISRFIIRIQKKEHFGFSDFNSIPPEYKPIFLELCQLAFQALCEDKIVFDKTDIENICKHLTLHSGNWNGLGLLKAVEFYNITKNVKNISFNFLHLSLQETLAAYYITLLPKNKQISLLKEHFLNSRYFNTWIMYVGLTKGQSYPFKHFLSGHRFQFSTTFSLWLSKNPGISKKLIANKVICLHLFQCFSEAENDDMCQYVGQLLQDQKIDLSGQTLNPVNVHTLGLFLGRSTTKHWKLLSLSNCYIGDREIERLYAFSSSSRTVVSIDELDLSYNNLSQSSAALLADLFLAWNIKRVKMYSGDGERRKIDSDTVNNVIDQISKIELVPNHMEIFITDKSFLIMCMQNYETVIAALSVRNYSSIHLLSCALGSSFKQTAQMVLMLAERSTKVCLHNCDVSSQDVVESVMKSNILSFYYDERSVAAPKGIEIVIQKLAEFAIKLGDNPLPLRIYNITDKTLGIIKEDIMQGINPGTFVFRNCEAKDIDEIVSYFSSLSNWEYFILSTSLVIPKFVFQQIASILRQKSLSQFMLSVRCSMDQAAAEDIADVFKNSTSLQHLSLLNCKLQNHNSLLMCQAVHSINTLVHINLSGNTIGNQAADILANGITANMLLQNLELAQCNLYEGGLSSVCGAISMRNLLTFDLSGNFITNKVAGKLAHAVTSTKYIENLHLKRCSLKYEGIQVLVVALAQIKTLKVLDLSHNNMSHTNLDVSPVVLANQCLESVNFSYCRLQKGTMVMLVKALNGENLKILNVSGIHITDSIARSMVVLLANAVGLHGLYLAKCGLQENALTQLMRNTNSALKYFDISFNTVSVDAAKHVASVISKSTNLAHLDLSNCGLQERGFAVIMKAILKCTMLEYIDLKSSQFNAVLEVEMAAFIFDNHRLDHLCLSDCALREEGLLRLVEGLKSTKLMQHLNISLNSVTDLVAKELASTDLLFGKSQLKQLNLSHCQLQTKGFSKILIATTNMYNLKCVNYSGCKITDEEARYLAGSITVNDTLEQLVLSHCELQPVGFLNILKELKKLNTLNYLDLSHNQITENAVITLGEVIYANRIEHLALSHCLQGANSSAVLTAIGSSVTLQYLDLSHNDINDDQANFVASAITANKCLFHVNLANNQFSSHGTRTILNAMAMINSLQLVDLRSFSISDELAVDLENVTSCNGALESIFIYKYAIQKVKLEQVPISTSKLVLTKLCINDHIVNDTEACTLESLIGGSSSICHLDLANSVIPDTRKPRIIKTMRKHSTLTHLNLSGISVTQEVEDDLTSLVADNANLNYLALADCKLKDSFLVKLPEALNAHKELLQLNLSSNTFSATAAASISKVVTNNARLEGLQMADCKLSETCLLRVVRALNKLNGIVNLNLTGNVLSDLAVEMLAKVVVNNSRLKKIELAGCKLNNTGIIKLVEAMDSGRLKELTDLNLSGSTITGQALDSLFSVVASCKKLKFLELCNCGITALKVSHFRTLHSMTTLRYLDFSNNPISDRYAGDLANLIARNIQLQHLNVSNCSLASEGVLKIVKVLKESTVLLHVDLGSNVLSDQLGNVASEIAALITNNNGIEQLCLPHCKFQDYDLTILFEAMKDIVSLKCIDIGCNQISDSLYKHVTSVVASNNNLEVFRLFKLVLSQSGLEQLYDVLPKFRALQVVSLKQCHVSDQQLSHFSVMIAKNPDITDFRITDCLLSDLGICEIFKSLKFVKLLQHLYLCSIVFSDNSVDDVATVIATNKDMEHLSLADCRMSECSKAKVLKALMATTTLQHFNINNIVVNEQVEDNLALVIANNVKLRSLELVGCGLTESGTEKLGNALDNHKDLSCIKLNCNTVSLEMSNLLNVIAKNTKLNQLELAHCDLEDTDILALTETVKRSHYKSFSHLNLSGNNLTDTATKSLLLMVISCLSFKHLELCDCGMIIPSMELPETLNFVLSLSYLDISHNPIGNEGAELVAAFISRNNTIKHVNLSSCKFQSSEINQLIKALKSISSLQFIDLSMNDTRNGTLVPIGPVISSNESLSFLHLPIYNFTKQDLDDIFEAVANVLSLKSKQNAKCFTSVAQITNFALQKLKVFEVHYDDNAVGRLNNMQNILGCFNDSGNKVSNFVDCPPSTFVPNSLIIEVGLCNTLKAVQNACSLEYLNFNNTRITDVIEHSMITAIANNKTLLHLEMATCGLKDTAIVKLAQAFDSLKNLLYLNVCQNDCRIMQLSSAISRFTELVHLDLSNCNISHSELSSNEPLSNKNLKYLDLSNNSITDEAVEQIVAIINNNKQLQHLNFSNCEFKPSGMKEIVSVLKTCTSLKYINLTSNIINDGLADGIAAVIDNNDDLSHVYLPDNVFSYKCVDVAIKKKVSLKNASSRTNQVATVKLKNLGIQIETIFNDVACKSLTSGIKYLAVNFNFVSKQALKLLIGYLNNNSSLEHLELAVSGLTEAYVRGLCNALRSFESLRFLSICCSDITVEAASSLADVLNANNNSLQHLILHNCTLNDVTLQKLSDALDNMSNLKCIDLSFNDFSYEAVSEIGKVITKNCSVEHLDLSNCRLKKANITRILSVLTEISELKYLNLSSNEKPDNASDAMAAVTSTNQNLKHENIKV